jgi:acyl-CoA thioesterase-2
MADQLTISDISFLDLLELEPHGPDTYVGRTVRYPWGGLFGGQIVAQALRAAHHTLDPEYQVHSLHAYFIRRGTNKEPVRFEVDRIRNGRSFSTRRVVARQSGGAILNLSCSFQKAEEAADVQIQELEPGLPRPESIEEDIGWGSMIERRVAVLEAGRSAIWVRMSQPLPDDQQLHACATAFFSDSVVTSVIRASHPLNVTNRSKAREHFVNASLDHSLYFQRAIDANQWLLADVTCHGLVGARGLSVGNLFDLEGIQKASVVQEVLMRERRNR